MADAPRFADAVRDGRLRVATRIFGLDAVLGCAGAQPAVTGHEAGVLVDVVADTEELAKEAAYFAFIRLFIGPYPGRKTTAGNAAAPIMPVVVPVSEVFTFSIYHLLPLADPLEPFALRWCRSRAAADRARSDRMRLYDAAAIIRSKNAGPFAVTIDLFFPDEDSYRLARSSALLTVAGVAAAYGVDESTVKGVWWDDRDPGGEGLAAAVVVQQRPVLLRPVRRAPAHPPGRRRAGLRNRESHEVRHPAHLDLRRERRRPRQQRQQHEELVRTAEQLGFDLMVCGQHFLGSELRYFQPVPWLTHMAQVAPTMHAATGIILLSMVNPVDIAEQMATLDVLTDGRAIFGVGLGYSGHEFDAFGVEPGTRVARFEESLRLVKRAVERRRRSTSTGASTACAVPGRRCSRCSRAARRSGSADRPPEPSSARRGWATPGTRRRSPRIPSSA